MPRELKLSKVVGRNSSNISRSAWSLAARASSIAVPVPRESFRPFISRFKLRSCIQLLFEADRAERFIFKVSQLIVHARLHRLFGGDTAHISKSQNSGRKGQLMPKKNRGALTQGGEIEQISPRA